MKTDSRAGMARYLDLHAASVFADDVPFYRARLPGPRARVLELGCGTGRVLVPLSRYCAFIQGIDLSPAMLAVCREKLRAAGVPSKRARVEEGDITHLELGRRFDLITAPFRVFQSLDADAQVDGFFRTVRGHLAPGGSCVLNVFKPDPDRLRRYASQAGEALEWEREVEGARVTCHVRLRGIDKQRQVLYPELILRRWGGDRLEEEVRVPIVMRYYQPDPFEQLIESHGFRILERFGGYAGERYGEGPELVIRFAAGK